MNRQNDTTSQQVELDLCRELAEEHFSYPPTMSFKDPKFTIEQLLDILREREYYIYMEWQGKFWSVDVWLDEKVPVNYESDTLKEALLRVTIAVMKEGGDA